MKETKCDGCGRREELDIPMKQRTIHPVKLMVVTDDRELHGAQAEQVQSDLCTTCVGIVKHMYFGQPAEGQLEVPAFVEPTSLERARAAER
jgi:hypothetical protein